MASLDGSMKIPLASGRRETYCLNVARSMNGSEAARLAGLHSMVASAGYRRCYNDPDADEDSPAPDRPCCPEGLSG